MIRDAECIDMRICESTWRCPVCKEECERVYYKMSQITHVLGCDMCIDYDDVDEYRQKISN